MLDRARDRKMPRCATGIYIGMPPGGSGCKIQMSACGGVVLGAGAALSLFLSLEGGANTSRNKRRKLSKARLLLQGCGVV